MSTKVYAFAPNHELKVYSSGAAGVDLHITEAPTIGPGEVHVVSTGIHVAIPEGMVGEVVMRSSYAKKGLILTNSPGQIDSDYRGEIKLLMCNVTRSPIELVEGHRVAQLLFKKTERPEIVRVDSIKALGSTERGDGGFGSTGE